MELFAKDPQLQNSHFGYEMTREEKMEANFLKTAQIYRTTPEDITYKNTYAYVMIGGIVRIEFSISIIDGYGIASLNV